MAAQTGTFVDDARLRPRDNSDGEKHSTEFGEHRGGSPAGEKPTGTIRSGGNMDRPDSMGAKVSKKGGY